MRGDSFRLTASDIRATVDAVDPGVCVEFCAAHCQWDISGTMPLELTNIVDPNRCLDLCAGTTGTWTTECEHSLQPRS